MAQAGGSVGIQGPFNVNFGDAAFSQGKQGEIYASNLAPRYYALNYYGKVFGAYAAGVATTVVGTGMVGLQVWNGSSGSSAVNLAILRVSGFVTVTSATTTGLAVATGTGQAAAPTGQTGITRSGSNFVGSNYTSQATAYNAGTYTNAPTALFPVLHNTAAIATTGEDAGYSVDLEGQLIIAPGCYVAMAALGATAGTAACFHYISWIELPI